MHNEILIERSTENQHHCNQKFKNKLTFKSGKNISTDMNSSLHLDCEEEDETTGLKTLKCRPQQRRRKGNLTIIRTTLIDLLY